MYLRVLSFSLILVMLSACLGDPEPDEFEQLRLNMERHQSNTFGNSVKHLENRKDKSYKRKKISSSELDMRTAELQAELEAEKKRWLDAGIDLEDAEDWKALGLSPKRANRWQKTGLSYNTIGVLIKEDIMPSEAISFMNRKFEKPPKAFSNFSEPLYKFQASCKKIIKASRDSLEKINKQCREYNQLLELSAVSGYMADEYEVNDLSLEYISKLRQVDNQKSYLQKQMEVRLKLCLINAEIKNFELLFPLLTTAPSKEEMYFIKQNKLALKDTQRYKSYEYYDFWVNKERNEEKVRLAAIEKQQALKRAKAKRLKAEAYRMNALAYNKMVASECGEGVTSIPSTGEKVHVEGKIQHVLGKKGSNIFAYVVKNAKDSKNYLIRDPNAKNEMAINTKVSWTALTVGRVVSVSLDDDGTASYNHYSDDDKEYYPMLKRLSNCPYFTKDISK